MNEIKHNRSIFRNILSILSLTLLLTTALVTKANASELVILYSNDIRGETEPCG